MEEKKKTPQLRFKGFTDDWEQRKLGDVVEYIKGFAFESKDYKKSGHRIIRVSDLGKDSIKNAKNAIFASDKLSSQQSRYKINKDEIIITTVGSKAELKESAVGRPIIVRKSLGYLLNQNLVKINGNSNHDNYFIYYQLLQPRYSRYVSVIQRGNANQANIAINDLWKFHIFMPKYHEQSKIGNFLDTLDNTITLQQKRIDKLKLIKQALLQKMFPENDEKVPKIRFLGFEDNWEQRKLGEVFEIQSGFTGNAQLNNGKFKISRIETISNGVIDSKKIGFSNIAPDKKYRLNVGDILYSNINSIDHIGKIAKYVEDIGLYHGINLLRLISISDNPDFLFYELNTEEKKIWAKRYANKAVNQASINQTELKKQNLNIPVIGEQIRIGNFLQQFDSLIALNHRKLELLKAEKQGLLQKMFI